MAASARILLPCRRSSAKHWTVMQCTLGHRSCSHCSQSMIWVIIEKTTLGYKLKAVGFNSNGAQYGGINARPFHPDGTWNLRTFLRSWRSCSGARYGWPSEPVCRTGGLRIRGNHRGTDRMDPIRSAVSSPDCSTVP